MRDEFPADKIRISDFCRTLKNSEKHDYYKPLIT